MARDDFNRSDGALGSPWFSDGVYTSSIGVVSNAAGALSAGSSQLAIYGGSNGTCSEVKIVTGSGADGEGVCIHADGAGSAYVVRGAFLFAYTPTDDGFGVFIGFLTEAEVGETLRLERDGDDLVQSIDGIETDRITHTAYSGGESGISDYWGTRNMDDWTDGSSPSGALTGAINASLSVTGALTGMGDVSTTVPMSFTPSGALSGPGNLPGLVPIAFALAGTLQGEGQISSSIPIALGVTGSLADATPGDRPIIEGSEFVAFGGFSSGVSAAREITIPSGVDGVYVAVCAWYGPSGGVESLGMTLDGVAADIFENLSDAGDGARASVAYFKNPGSGAKDLVITYASSPAAFTYGPTGVAWYTSGGDIDVGWAAIAHDWLAVQTGVPEATIAADPTDLLVAVGFTNNSSNPPYLQLNDAADTRDAEWVNQARGTASVDEDAAFGVALSYLDGDPASSETIESYLTANSDGTGTQTTDWNKVIVLTIPAASAGGSLNGSVSMALAVAGALTGSGALSSTIALSYSVNGTLIANGSLSSTLPSTLTVSGALTGLGALASTLSISLTVAGQLTGNGALAGAVPLMWAASGTLQGNGALTGAIAAAMSLAGVLRGDGALSSTIASVFVVSGSLTSFAGLAGSIQITFSPTGTLTGNGALVGALSAAWSVAGALTSLNALAGAVAINLVVSGTLTANGSLVGAISFAFTPTGTLTGMGALVGSVSPQLNVSGTLRGDGALSVSIPIQLSMAGQLVGNGALSASLQMTTTVAGTLTNNAPGSLFSTISMNSDVNGTMIGNGALIGSIAMNWTLLTDLRGLGQLTAAISLASSLTGTMTSTSQMQGVIDLTFALVAVPVLQVPGAISSTFAVAGALSGEGTLSSAVALSWTINGTLIDSANPVDSGINIELLASQRLDFALQGQYTARWDLMGGRISTIVLSAEQN